MTQVVCQQTGLKPNRRTIVRSFAWVLGFKNLQPYVDFWIDTSECGLAQCDARLAELTEEYDNEVRFAIQQWHIYFEDGGHARPQIRYDMEQAEKSYNHYYPERAPAVLSPTPEYFLQEGITQ